MNLWDRYCKYVGLVKETVEYNPVANYKTTKKINIALRHLDYLKELFEFQKSRQETIENKNSQIVGQASIIISIFSLFIPLLIDNLINQSLVIIAPLILGFIFVLFHFILSIYYATKTLEINRYPYATRDTTTVTGYGRAKTELLFIEEEISDLIFAAERNDIQNNRKGANLIFATRNFRIGSFGFSMFALIIIISSFFWDSKPKSMKIDDMSDSVLIDLRNSISERSHIKNDSLKVADLEKKIAIINDQIDSLKINVLEMSKNKQKYEFDNKRSQ